jgi:hypothetical protein
MLVLNLWLFFLFLTRKAKTVRKPVIKKGSQTNLKDPVGVRCVCVCVCVCVFSFFSPLLVCVCLKGEESNMKVGLKSTQLNRCTELYKAGFSWEVCFL